MNQFNTKIDSNGTANLPEHAQEGFSPFRFLLTTIAAVFLAEVFAMNVLIPFQTLPYSTQTLLDAVIMVVLISPVLYFLSFRPLLVHIKRRRRAEQQLHEMALFPTLNPDAVLQVDARGQIMKTNPAATKIGLVVGAQLSDLIPDLQDLDLPGCIAEGKTQQVHQTQWGEQVLQWVIHGTPELGLAFFYSTDVTERIRAEAEIRQLSSIVEQTADTVVVTNPDGLIEYVNPAFEQQTGYCREEVLGQTPRVLKSGIHDDLFYRDLWNTILSGESYQNEITNRRKDGTLLHEVKTIMPLRDAKGNITHFVATGKDITERKEAEEKLKHAYDQLELRVQERTEELRIANSELEEEIGERKQAEQALRTSEQRLNRAQEISHLGSWELDVAQDRLTWSDEVYRLFGLQPQEFGATYEAFLEAVHPEDRLAVDAAYSSSLKDGRDMYEIEHRVISRSSGEIRIVHEKCEHFRNETGQIIRSVGMVHDITERKQAEVALRRAHDELEQRVQERTAELAIANRELLNEIAERREVERQLRIQAAAMEAAANGIVITNAQGDIMWTNPALTQLSGYGADELLGQSTRIFNSGQHGSGFYSDMWSTIMSGDVWKGEIINRRKDGSQYIEGQTITPVLNENGGISHFIAIKEDITEKKQAEQAMRARDEREKALTQTIHTMQLDIARDLHDTLGQNISFLRMKLDFLTGRKIRKQADLQMEIQNMARAANESYDLMRGTLAILQSTDSADLYRLFSRYTKQIEERSGFQIDISSHGEPKPISAPRMRQLFYIFREILSNIEKHAGASLVNIEMIWEADHLKLMVCDNGQGFDVDAVQFGSHYGLKFMRERVQVLNGSLTLRSDPEAGTSLAVLIPYETS